MHTFLPSDARLQYMGRIDFTAPDAPAFIWAGSLVQFRFTGGRIALEIENHVNYNGLQIGYLLDGKEGQIMLSADAKPQRYELTAEGSGVHRFVLFKRQDSTHWFRLLGIGLEGELCEQPALPDLRLECYGDSVTAGSVVEAVDHVAGNDPPVYDSTMDNAWHSYAMQAARLLHAQVHVTAQGGIALFDNTGYFDNGRYGMETAYDKLWYLPYEPMTAWDFSRYQPDFVTFAIGQNDQHVDGKDSILSPERREQWLDRYCAMLRDLMEKYPKATFILMLTVLMHDEFWETLLDDACKRLDSPRVKRLRFTRSGKATPGHPRIPEQCEMACELAEYIAQLQAEAPCSL